MAILALKPHPSEDGFYRETYRSALAFPESALPDNSQGPEGAATAIYNLPFASSFSALHRLPTDEGFPFYQDDPADMLISDRGRSGLRIISGTELDAG
ncbi:MAG: cupin domain-containing protein [Acidobacteriota bacterium]